MAVNQPLPETSGEVEVLSDEDHHSDELEAELAKLQSSVKRLLIMMMFLNICQ